MQETKNQITGGSEKNSAPEMAPAVCHRSSLPTRNRAFTRRTTTKRVEAGNFTGITPEFGRCADLQRVFGIRRGTAYNLWKAGKIKGCLLRVTGEKSGVRLWHMAGVREYILSQMEQEAAI